MKLYVITFLLLGLAACNSSPRPEGVDQAITLDSSEIVTDSAFAEEWSGEFSEYDTFFVVIVDTGLDYYTLDRKMYALQRQFQMNIDTMGRYFNTKKNLIALPDDDADEIYAGEYYPRRYPSADLSIEYLNMFEAGVAEKAMALVGGIYETAKSADSAVAVLRAKEPKTYAVEAQFFVGCMH